MLRHWLGSFKFCTIKAWLITHSRIVNRVFSALSTRFVLIDVKVWSHWSAKAVWRPFNRALVTSWCIFISILLGLSWSWWFMGTLIIQSRSYTCNPSLIVLSIHEVISCVWFPSFLVISVLEFFTASLAIFWHSAASKRFFIINNCVRIKSERVYSIVLRFVSLVMLIWFSFVIILWMAIWRKIIATQWWRVLFFLIISFFQMLLIRLFPRRFVS